MSDQNTNSESFVSLFTQNFLPMKRWILLTLILIVSNADWAVAQDRPYLIINYRSNLLGQRLEIYDGEQRLNRTQISTVLQNDPDAYDLYRRALVNKRWQTAMDVSAGAMLAGSLYLIILPQNTQTASNNLFLPIIIGNVVSGLASGIFRRKSRELTSQAIEVYNLGAQGNPYIQQQNNTYNFPGMSYRINF